MTPGKTKKKTGRIFRKAQKRGPTRAFLSSFAASTSLVDDRLVATPIPDPDHRIAEQNGIPGKDRTVSEGSLAGELKVEGN